jgi:predicted TIM-barrel fold metal-dependent hydrolase
LLAPAVWAEGTATVPHTAVQPHRIDVHHHMFPPFVQERWKKDNIRALPAALRWTLTATIEQMEQGGVATAILSMPGGGLNLPRLRMNQARSMTRMINDYAAKVRLDHPGRFGFFAHVPMPDVDGTLKEIEYVLDQLKADGIGLSTSYGDMFLGDPDFKPVMDELQRRRAIVYVHPARPNCCDTLRQHAPGPFDVNSQDTKRTIMSLLFSGTLTRSRNVHWVFSHGGAALPLLAGRVNALAKIQLKITAQVLPDGVDFELKRLFYETANATDSSDIAALLKFTSASQILFGSDCPYVSVVENVAGLAKAGLSVTDLKAIESDNALRLMPHLRPA